MRHQYLGVKQKIRLSDDRFNWADGDSHWENFSKYKEVFGDVDLQVKDSDEDDGGDESGQDLMLGFEGDSVDDDDDDVSSDQHRVEGVNFHRTGRKLGLLGGRLLELRDGIMKMEERKRQREFEAEEASIKSIRNSLLIDELYEQQEHEAEMRAVQEEAREMEWEKKQLERWMRDDEEVENERLRRMRMEEKREEEEIEWKEKMLRLQIEHDKSMLQMYSNACHNQIQVLGAFSRLLCHLFESGSGGLDASVPAQANMPETKPDSSSQAPESLEHHCNFAP